jgi:hypothetical protein
MAAGPPMLAVTWIMREGIAKSFMVTMTSQSDFPSVVVFLGVAIVLLTPALPQRH